MVTGLLPVVGVPLPILSYGGTAMLTNMIGLGIVLGSKLYNEDFI
jgi:rod shape determining protein RodA